ncbi:MAG: hypothetical protein OEW58_11240 [Gammaproteobacteria bacterium]|nr:hypothetical protein [Gammaproteobacteria bacterium]
MSQTSQNFTLAYYSGNRKTGSIAILSRDHGKLNVKALPIEAESALEKNLKPIFVGLTETHQVITLDPKSKELRFGNAFPTDAFAAHIYSDPKSGRDWLMNDGDKETGNDTLNCGDKGSSVTVIENSNSSQAKYLATICVGRGHHQATFSYPSAQKPNVPQQAYISNLKDGTLSVIDNDPNSANYLRVIATINLGEADKEESGKIDVPNNSFPHGLAYSPISGKIYNLNNGYGTVAVIDPATHQIEERFAFKGHSNLFVSPSGRYIIGRGADRKTNAAHVFAKMAVYDVVEKKVTDSINLQDIYISKYFFNPEGSKLYLTTSASGNDEQTANCKASTVLSFDMNALPKLVLLNECDLGSPTGTLDFLQTQGKTSHVFASNAEQGEIVILDGKSDNVIERVKAGESVPHSRLWLLK